MIEKIQKIRLILPKEKVPAILKKIAELECVDFHELKNNSYFEPEKSEKIDNLKEEIRIAEALLTFVSEKKSSLFSQEDFNKFLLLGKKTIAEIKELKLEERELRKKMLELKPLRLLDITNKQSKELFWLALLLLEGKKDSHRDLANYFKKNLIFQFVGKKDNEREIFLYIFPKVLESEIFKKIKELKLQILSLPEKSPKAEIEKLRDALKTIKQKIAAKEENLRKAAPSKKDWLKFIFELKWHLNFLEIYLKAPQTEKFSIFEGWVLDNRFKNLLESLKEISDFVVVEKIPFEPNEAPVALKNHKIIKPFEMITKLYGLPKPSEVDPTAFLAPFFVVFFGFALSDAGYGIFLILLGFLLLFLTKKLEIFRSVGLLSLFTGISTLIFGLLLGTFFGTNLSKFIDPQLEPMKVLNLCFAFGILQIISGLLISFWHKTKHGVRFIDAFNEHGFWVFVLTSFFLLIIQDVFSFHLILPKNLLIFGFVLLFVNLLTTTIFSPKIITGFLKGLAGLYSGVGFLADTLSYSRLFALGLATGVVAYTVNLVAAILKGMINIPILSQLIFFSVLIVGHSFNLAINVLGSFIHSSRLQFVEFFSKFLEGGGRQFNPLKFN